MGRFYKTTQAKFVDDFVFKPNYELIGKILEKENQQALNNYKTLKFFEELPFQYWEDADSENMEAIKQRYDVSDIIEGFKEDPKNKEYLNRIQSLSGSFKEDWEKGDLRKIRENYQNYKKYSDILKNLDPEDREIYKVRINRYLRNNEGKGALKEIFDPGKVYAKEDIINKFLQSDYYKKLKADSNLTDKEIKQGLYYKTTTTGDEGLKLQKVQDAFKLFVSENYEDYMKVRQDLSSETPFKETYFDENGNILFEDKNSTIGQLYDKLDTYTWNKHTEKIRRQVNQPALWYWKQKQIKKMQEEDLSAAPIGTRDISAYYKTAPGIKQMQKYRASLTTFLKQLGVVPEAYNKLELPDLERVLLNVSNSLKNHPDKKKAKLAEAIYNKYNELRASFDDEMQAGDKALAMAGWDKKSINEANAILKKRKHNIFKASKGVFTLPIGDNEITLTGDNPQNYNAVIGKEIEFNGKKYRIAKAEPEGEPLLAPGMTFNDKKGMTLATDKDSFEVRNGIVQDVKYTLEPVIEGTSVKDITEAGESIEAVGTVYFDDVTNLDIIYKK